MAKRKTRKQKILADHRHVLYHLETTPAQVSIPAEKKATLELPAFETPQAQTHALPSYSYVVSDIKKTAFITFSIATAQIVLFFVLNRI